MASNTFTKIATVTVGSGGASNIQFTSIPSTYTDLCVKVSLRGSGTNTYDVVELRFNGDTGTNYVMRRLYGGGSGGGTSEQNTLNRMNVGYSDDNGNTSSVFSNGEIYIPNYTSSNYKSVSADHVSENNATFAIAGIFCGLWNSTSAITSITIYPEYSSTWVQYSTAVLYGIKNS